MRGRMAIVMNLVLGAVMASTGIGCGDSLKKPPMGKVRGTVTYKGAPVGSGTVTFFPTEATTGEAAQPAISELGPDGSFALSTFDPGDGVVTGEHKVIILARSPGSGKLAEGLIPSLNPKDLKKNEGPKPLVPPIYMDAAKTPLRCTVTPGDNTFALELKD